MGLVVFAAITLYVIVSIAVVVFAARAAKKKGRNPWRWGGAAALVMYLLVFWDHIPTVVAHKYYCEKEAGFWVYKTLDQWKKENPGVAETLVAGKGVSSARQGDMENYTDTYFLNQRFKWVVKHNGQFLFNRWRHDQVVIDIRNGDVLAQYIDFSSSQIQRKAGWSGWKMWLDVRHCSGGTNDERKMGKFMLDAKNLSKEDRK